MDPDNEAVLYQVIDHIACLTLSHPPVNALSAAVRARLQVAVLRAETDADVHAILIVGAGKGFSAGADMRQLEGGRQMPLLHHVCDTIEDCHKPVIAAIHGTALGGGLEVALAAHYRLAAPSARLGMPEVQLGLIPGGGGTQRAPRLIDAQSALDMMISGHPVSAQEALRLGLIDRVASSEDILTEGLAFAHSLLAEGSPVRRTRDQTQALADLPAQQAAIDAARADVGKQRSKSLSLAALLAPKKIIDAVQAAIDLPFHEGLRIEQALFEECLASPQRAGLVHAFFAEREVLKSPETRHAHARPIHHVGVVGGGTMGAGIAVSLLDAGLRVTLIERDDHALSLGKGRIEKVYDALIAKGRLAPQSKAETLARLRTAASYEALVHADLVIEAVFEDMAVKHAVFAQLDRFCKPGAVLATNTSYLDIDAIAHSISRPRDVIGLHFFSPANIMKLLEIVVPAKVAPDVVATGFELARLLKKVPVRAGVCDGFIGNRILAVYRTAADHMMEDGASPYEIDQMAREFGFPMGPYEVSDLAGGDIGWATRKRRAATRDPRARYVRIADRLCEQGWFGHKTGRGWYQYPNGPRGGGMPDPEVQAIIEDERAKTNIRPRTFTLEELQRRYLAAMVNEGAKVVAEGIALRPLDVDVTLVHGYGFPRHRGGPMKYADIVGLHRILRDIRQFAEEDRLFWQPAPLLIQLVEEGRDFESLNRR